MLERPNNLQGELENMLIFILIYETTMDSHQVFSLLFMSNSDGSMLNASPTQVKNKDKKPKDTKTY